jgi:hypothetical protein
MIRQTHTGPAYYLRNSDLKHKCLPASVQSAARRRTHLFGCEGAEQITLAIERGGQRLVDQLLAKQLGLCVQVVRKLPGEDKRHNPYIILYTKSIQHVSELGMGVPCHSRLSGRSGSFALLRKGYAGRRSRSAAVFAHPGCDPSRDHGAAGYKAAPLEKTGSGPTKNAHPCGGLAAIHARPLAGRRPGDGWLRKCSPPRAGDLTPPKARHNAVNKKVRPKTIVRSSTYYCGTEP